MDTFISGAWRSITRAEAQIGGGWRSITRGEAYINGAWRTILSFAQPLTLSVPPEVEAYAFSPKPMTQIARTGPITATPFGGTAPYSYNWTISSGVASIESPFTATTSFSASVPSGGQRFAVASVTCTDARGVTATGTCSITFYNETNA